MKLFVTLGALAMFLGVALGAFGAHGLKQRVAMDLLAIWNTAVLYHLVHALGLILVGILVQLLPGHPQFVTAGWFLLAGMLIFSGSLYLLVLSGYKPLGMITPLGGVSFLVGWLLLAVAAFRCGG